MVSLEKSQKEIVFIVTLAVFSGRPDPQWPVSSVTNAVLFNQIQGAIAKGQALTPSQMPAILGYKGFLVQKAGSKKNTYLSEKAALTFKLR